MSLTPNESLPTTLANALTITKKGLQTLPGEKINPAVSNTSNSSFLNFLQSAQRKRAQQVAKMTSAETTLMKILDKAEQAAEYTATATPAANRF